MVDNPELEVELSGAIAVNELGGRRVEFEVTWLETEQVPVEDELSEDTLGEACWRVKRWHNIIQLSLDILFEIIIGLSHPVKVSQDLQIILHELFLETIILWSHLRR